MEQWRTLFNDTVNRTRRLSIKDKLASVGVGAQFTPATLIISIFLCAASQRAGDALHSTLSPCTTGRTSYFSQNALTCSKTLEAGPMVIDVGSPSRERERERERAREREC